MAPFGASRAGLMSTRVDAIPDSDVYLQDDWGDNKLTDRDDSGTTTHNGVEGVYRPEWTAPSGFSTANAENEQLEISDGEAVSTNINLNLDETVTWEFSVDYSSGGTDSGRATSIALYSESLKYDDSAGFRPNTSYVFWGGRDVDFRISEIDDNGNVTDLISGLTPSDELFDVKVTRQPNGEWELFIDDSSQGSDTDTTHTNPEHCVITAEDGDVQTHIIPDIKVF